MITNSSVTSGISSTLEIIEEHLHSIQRVAPSGAAGITVASGGGAWTLAAASANIIAANGDHSGGTETFDLHGFDVENPSANANYEIVFYGKLNGVANTEIGRATFTRTSPTTFSRSTALQTPRVDAGSNIYAKLMDSVGGSTCVVKVWYHNYD